MSKCLKLSLCTLGFIANMWIWFSIAFFIFTDSLPYYLLCFMSCIIIGAFIFTYAQIVADDEK